GLSCASTIVTAASPAAIAAPRMTRRLNFARACEGRAMSIAERGAPAAGTASRKLVWVDEGGVFNLEKKFSLLAPTHSAAPPSPRSAPPAAPAASRPPARHPAAPASLR